MTDAAEFRRQAHALVDWMADYLDTLEARPVTPDTTPGATATRLPATPPEAAEPFADIWRDFQQLVLPGMAHWQHPGWMAYFPASSSPPSILAEMATATLAAQCMSWQTSPAATELEQVTLEWLRQLVGLPEGLTGSIQDTASTATLVAVLSARERATGGAFASAGASAPGAGLLVAYTSEEAHSSVPKAVRLAGFGEDRLRRVPVDDTFALRPDRLGAMMDADRAAGLVPACVVATIGTTSSTALDPIRPIGEHCVRHGAWLHVDAAYAGSAAVCPEHRSILAGVEYADSFVFNPHKWLLTNFDCTAYYVRDPALLVRTFGTAPAYLRGAFDAEVPNYRDWGIQLGRRFRALKLWFVIRSLGTEGLRAHIRKGIALGRLLERLAGDEPGWEVVAPAPLALVCLRHLPRGASPEAVDEHNRRILARVNSDRRFHLTSTILAGRQVIRLAVGGRLTEERHVRAVWEELRSAASEQRIANSE